jgi:hypothetical protein
LRRAGGDALIMITVATRGEVTLALSSTSRRCHALRCLPRRVPTLARCKSTVFGPLRSSVVTHHGLV